MPGHTTERAVGTYVEEILLTRGIRKSDRQSAMERLQEYRPALLTAAVTSKIDVRAVKR